VVGGVWNSQNERLKKGGCDLYICPLYYRVSGSAKLCKQCLRTQAQGYKPKSENGDTPTYYSERSWLRFRLFTLHV